MAKRLLIYLEQATGIEPASQAWEACILTIVLCLQKGNTKIYCPRAKPIHHGLCSFLYFLLYLIFKRQDVNPTQAPRVLLKTSSNSQSPLPVIYCVISIPAEKARDIRKTFFELRDTAKIRQQNTQGDKHCNVTENLYQPKIPQILDAYVLQKVSHLPEGHKLSLTFSPLSV